MALEHLASRLTPSAVDLAPTLYSGTPRNLVGPAQHVRVLVHGEELARLVKLPLTNVPYQGHTAMSAMV